MEKKLEIFKNVLLILVVGFLAFTCFWDIGKEPLEKWDERVYIDVVKSSLQDDSYLVPKINSLEGEFDMLTFNDNYFYEKPPIWFWIAFGVTKVFGYSSDYLRYISAVSGFLIGLILIFIAKKYFGKITAIFTGLVFATTGHLFVMNVANIYSSHNIRTICLDVLQMLFIVVSQYFILKFVEEVKKSKKSSSFAKAMEDTKVKSKKPNINLMLIALFTSLGILTKGVFSLIPVFLLFVDLIFIQKESFKNWLKTFLLITFYLLLMLLPWHLYMTFQGGWDFWNNYFFYHNLNRSFNAIEGHNEAWYFHILNFFNPEFFTSGLAFFITVFYLIQKKRFFEPVLFHFTTYTLLCLFLATIIQTKLSWYALYIYPSAALISGYGYCLLFKYLKSMMTKTILSTNQGAHKGTPLHQ